MITFLNEMEKQLFAQITERTDRVYDESACMITEWRGKNGYHSRLEDCLVHVVVGSMEYAYDLMCRDQAGDFERAEAILRTVLSLQDQNPQSATYGIWPYFLEESLDEMNPPDWNMADFNGKRICQMLQDYEDRISAELLPAMKKSLECACEAIKRRNVGPGYSNISVMGAYVTMAAGEYLGNEDLCRYALERMERLYRFNMEHGALQEYNSPSYTWIVLGDLAAVQTYIRNQEFSAMAEELNRLVWRCLAEHYHYRTKQWAGPHSRLYGMMEDDQILMQIQRALDYRIQLVDLNKEGLADHLPRTFFAVRSCCPAEFVTFFTGETKQRSGYVRYLRAEDEREEDIAASYLTQDCTLGTFHKAMFWNQRRSHISYFETEQGAVYCCMRCLHDFYDYSSAFHITAQDRNRSLTVFGFVTDGGDTHPDLDKVKNGKICARDLRVRLELGGAVSGVTVRQSGQEAYIGIGACTLHVSVPCAVLGTKKAVLKVTEEIGHVNETGDHREEGTVKCVDVVLYEGEERDLDFTAMDQCFGVIGFEILQPGEESWGEPEVDYADAAVTASMKSLKVTASKTACPIREYLHRGAAWVDGRTYREMADSSESLQ